jgi:acetate---CoA ligase (ADP-forming)
MANSQNLARLMAPRHIAFIGGASMADAVIRCREGGFTGEIWLVNPKHGQIKGVPCYASVKDLPSPPDASFLATNRNLAIDIVRDLSAMGAAGAVCYASGFAEVDEHGAKLQQQLLDAAGDMAIIGPNCYGLLDYLHGAALWPVAHGGKLVENGVAIVTQSGNFAYNLSMTDRSLPLAYMVSVGNQASVTVADIINSLLEQPRVTAIGLHLEGLKDVDSFAQAAARALKKGVPIIALKTGTSAIGAELALSHTSSLAGSDQLYDTLFKRLGIIRVSGPISFIETLKILAQGNLPKGGEVAALACSGGDAGLIADYCESNNLQLAQPTAAQTQALDKVLPDFANIANPLDFTTAIWGDEQALTDCANAMLDGQYDIGFLVLDYPNEDTGERGECDLMAEVFQRALKAKGIPGIVASVFPELLPESAREKLHSLGVPALQGVEDALLALGKVVEYSKRRTHLLEQLEQESAPTSLLKTPALTETPLVMDEWNSKQLLAQYGLPVPAAKLVTPGKAAAAAQEIGFPVVAKITSSELAHKTEAGAVALNLKNVQDVEAAVSTMVNKLNQSHPHIATDAILIEKMAGKPVAELIIGIKRETDFGMALVIGAGGILVELVKDSTTLLLPTNENAIREALQTLKISPLLTGFRGQAGGDIDALVKAINAVAEYATQNVEHLAELDINPLMVMEDGVVAVDALIRSSAVEVDNEAPLVNQA